MTLRKLGMRIPMLVSTHLSAITHRTLRPSVGNVIMQQGSLAERVLVVQAGELSVERTEAGGQPRPIATVGPGEMAGEMALMGDQTHSATVTVSRGPRDLLQAAVYDSDLVIELLTLSSHRCRETSRHLALILESLDALSNSDHSNLMQCCEELDKSYGPCFSNSAEQLKQLAAKLQQAQPET
jgi:CRP-like cAMP-binding protein